MYAPTIYATAAAGVSLPMTADTETVIVTMPACDPTLLAGFLIQSFLVCAPEASTTGVTLRIRRGSLTGAQVGADWPYTFTAPGPATPLFIHATDTPGNVADQVYVITAQQVGSGGNGAVTDHTTRVTTVQTQSAGVG